MKVEILGSGGAATIPRPGCRCRVCVEAREKGGRYARTGPSTFVHGPNIVFDTPEESKLQLERAGVGQIAACFYSHWHPDHTMGRRVWETRNGDFRTWPREAKRPLVTDVYLPEQVAVDFRVWLGGMAHLEFMQSRGWIRIHELADGDIVDIDGVRVRPFRLAEDYVYAFELSEGDRTLVVAMDELNGWSPPPEVTGCELAVLPMGICEFDLFTGERLIHEEHPVLRFEATFEETLGIVAGLDASRVVLSHVEEMDCISYGDLLRVEQRLQDEGRDVRFAWDGDDGRRVTMPRSLVIVDLAAIRHNVRVLRAAARPRRAVGRGQGGRVRARGGGGRPGGGRRGRNRARRRHAWARRPSCGVRFRALGSSFSARSGADELDDMRAARLELCASEGARSRKAFRSISSSTPGWDAGGSRSSRRPTRVSSA